MKIHDRYCQGLRASSDSQRRTVAVEMDAQIPSATACRAGSGQLHRDIGNPASAGGVQAAALTVATCTAGTEHRWPAAAVRVAQRRHPRCRAPAAAPLAHGVLAHPQRRRDPRGRLSLGGGEHDLRARYQTLLGAPGPDQASQCTALRTGRT